MSPKSILTHPLIVLQNIRQPCPALAVIEYSNRLTAHILQCVLFPPVHALPPVDFPTSNPCQYFVLHGQLYRNTASSPTDTPILQHTWMLAAEETLSLCRGSFQNVRSRLMSVSVPPNTRNSEKHFLLYPPERIALLGCHSAQCRYGTNVYILSLFLHSMSLSRRIKEQWHPPLFSHRLKAS